MNPQPKTKRYESKKYKAFIREQPCEVCGRQSEPHHESSLEGGIMGGKVSDSLCIPLCREHHLEVGRGVKTFYEKYNLDPKMIVIRLLTKYLGGLEK